MAFKNASGKKKQKPRDEDVRYNQRRPSREAPKYGWQNIYGWDNDGGKVGGSIVFSKEFILSLAFRILDKEYEGEEDDLPLDITDNDEVRLSFSLRPSSSDSKCDWLGNVYEKDLIETKNQRRTSQLGRRSSRVSQYEDFDDGEIPAVAKKRGGRYARREKFVQEDDDDDYDDRPF